MEISLQVHTLLVCINVENPPNAVAAMQNIAFMEMLYVDWEI